MEAIIWTKITSTGAKVEIGMDHIYVNGVRNERMTSKSRELPRNQQVSKDGKLYTHAVGPIAMTREEAADFDRTLRAAYRALPTTYVETAADRSDALAREMAREDSAL